MSNSWFRLYSEFSVDPKVQMLSESDQRRLVMLFCLRCNGHVTLHDEEVTFMLRISNDEWQKTKSIFIAKGFIDDENELLNWDKRQYSSDSSKNRVAAYRDRKKREKSTSYSNDDGALSDVDTCNGHVTLHVTDDVTNSNAIDTDTDTDTDTELNTIDTNVSIVVNDESIPDCPHQEIISLYKKNLPMGIQPKAWDGARASTLKTRWRERKERQSLAWWDKFFVYVSQSKFLTGQVAIKDRKPFEVTLPWLLKQENFNKIIEGYYHR